MMLQIISDLPSKSKMKNQLHQPIIFESIVIEPS